MKVKHLVITILFFIGMITVQAQRGERPDPKVQAKNSADTWKKELDLSDDQHKKVYDFLIVSSENRNKKMQEMRSSGDRSGMRDAMTKLQEEADKGLKKIFTKAQWPKYLQWKKDNPPRRRGRRN
jgi:hypothetical protein